MNPKFNSLVICMLIITAITGCDSCKTQPNVNDTTPPTFEFTVHNSATGASTTYTGTSTHHAAYGEALTITACAIDNGGLKELEVVTNAAHTCISGNLAQQTGPGLAVPQTFTLGLDTAGNAWSRYCTFQNATLNFTCGQGFSFSSGYWSVSVSAKNYANLSGNAGLTIAVP